MSDAMLRSLEREARMGGDRAAWRAAARRAGLVLVDDLIASKVRPEDRGPRNLGVTIIQQADPTEIDEDVYERLAGDA